MLPVAGGLYDQDPALLMEWDVILSVKAKVERQKAEDAKRNRGRR